MSEENKIRDTIEAATGLVQAIPIYQDAIQPAAKEIGGALQTVAKAIHVALAPVSAQAPFGIPGQFVDQNDNACSAGLGKLVGNLLRNGQHP